MHSLVQILVFWSEEPKEGTNVTVNSKHRKCKTVNNNIVNLNSKHRKCKKVNGKHRKRIA